MHLYWKLNVSLFEGSKESEIEHGGVVLNEGSESLDNPKSNENEKVGGVANNAKSVLPKDSNTALKLKAP